MSEGNPAGAQGPMAEAIGTTGLFLNVTAVIAIAVCLASWGSANGTLALLAGAIALISFVTSILCFLAQAEERERQQITVG
jgi:F0F1-type ATP synthase assembly protein I